MTITFRPYIVYRSNTKRIKEFEVITTLSYGLSQQLLFQYPREKLTPLKISPAKDELSYSSADVNLAEIEEVCRWVTLQELSILVMLPLDELASAAETGQLGPINKHPKTGELLTIWPESFRCHAIEDLPGPDKKTYQATLNITASASTDLDPADLEQYEIIQQQFLTLAHAVGQPDQVSQRAEEMLYRSCVLLYWTAFEVFIRSTIHELYRRHPNVLAVGKRGKTNTLSYEELLTLSNHFTDAEALRVALVERAIEKEESDGQSVHGLINLLKSDFRFQKDPYISWYVIRGERTPVTYNDLMLVKDTRNALLHDGGFPRPEFFNSNPTVPCRGGEIIIDELFFLRVSLILDSIAGGIAKSIDERRYTV